MKTVFSRKLILLNLRQMVGSDNDFLHRDTKEFIFHGPCNRDYSLFKTRLSTYKVKNNNIAEINEFPNQ